MSNDKQKRKVIILIVFALIVINLIVFGFLFLDLSKYIWPEKEKPIVQGTEKYVLAADGTVTIEGITYKVKDDKNYIVVSADKSLIEAEIKNKINEDDTGVVNEIGDKAFENCSYLTSLLIPDTITKINNLVFSGCTNLNTITIPYSVKEIGNSCFLNCKNLASIKVNVSNTNFSEYNGVLYDIEGKIFYVYPYKKPNDSYVLSDKLEVIKANAFRGLESLVNVTFPESLKEIEDSAFEDCENLVNVYLPKSVEKIGENAFKNCNEDLVIYGEKGSYAETYAKENEITFKLVSERPETTSRPTTSITNNNSETNTNTSVVQNTVANGITSNTITNNIVSNSAENVTSNSTVSNNTTSSNTTASNSNAISLIDTL